MYSHTTAGTLIALSLKKFSIEGNITAFFVVNYDL